MSLSYRFDVCERARARALIPIMSVCNSCVYSLCSGFLRLATKQHSLLSHKLFECFLIVNTSISKRLRWPECSCFVACLLFPKRKHQTHTAAVVVYFFFSSFYFCFFFRRRFYLLVICLFSIENLCVGWHYYPVISSDRQALFHSISLHKNSALIRTHALQLPQSYLSYQQIKSIQRIWCDKM